MSEALNLSGRELSLIRMQRLHTLKEAIHVQGMEIEREIVMSQGSSVASSAGTSLLGQDSSPSTATPGRVIDVQKSDSAIQGVKRRVIFPDEDEGQSLSKYSKLTTAQKIVNNKTQKLSDTSSSSSSSDDLSDDSSLGEDKHQEIDQTSIAKNDAQENHCRSYGTIIVQTEKKELEIPVANEVIIPDNSYIVQSTMNGECKEQVHQQHLIANIEFEEADADDTQLPTDRKKDFDLKKSNLHDLTTQSTSENTVQVYNSTPQNLPCEYQVIQSYQTPSTSAGEVEQTYCEEVKDNSGISLVQLVLSLKQDVQELTRKIEKQENILGTVVQANEIYLAPLFAPSFPERYNLKIPFTRMAEFERFNRELTRNIRFCNEFIASLCSYIDNNVSLAKNILNMVRTYMTKELAGLFTASKPTGNKMVLKETLFCKCLLQATKMSLRNGLLPLEHEKAFMKNLSVVIGGSKGWHTHDDERRNNDQE